ncbi:alpha/beta fold hydrolase [Umezawaea tangerina]|uniref:Pimeloyl-ACP methyl ester carboxylesterase n=1 Tax=Umezawaea tangerina TaxID=84725 RepID=A0A2T0TH99_9PSEU|nr:alpha/beta fold hydrolase [Umezawaea tangerina]PRY44988.1 pimeloyl-ACP methyl ester carboxylesterase [Umezawaea tangerina]
MKPSIAYEVTGAGPPVLLLHGLGGDRRQALGLLPDGFEATRIAPDLPGHGDTDLVAGEPVTFAGFAGLVADLLDALRPRGKLAVVGVSMGAGIAVALAVARPDLVERLVLVRPAWLDVRPAPNLAPFRQIARLLETHGAEAGREAFVRTPEYRAVEAAAPAMAMSLVGQFGRPDAVGRAGVLDALPNDLPLAERDAYAGLGVDTVVIAAPDDPVHPESAARTLADWIPGARLVGVPRKMPDPAEHQSAVQREVAAALCRGRTRGGG